MPDGIIPSEPAYSQIVAAVREVLGNERTPVPNAGLQPHQPSGRARGITVDAIAKGATGTVRLLGGLLGSEEPILDVDGVSFVEVEAYALNGDIGAGKRVQMDFWGAAWEITNGECD